MRPSPARLRAFWLMGVFPAVLAGSAAIVGGQEAAEAGGNGWSVAAAGFAVGACLTLGLQIALRRWGSPVRRFPTFSVWGLLALLLIAPLWSFFGAGVHTAVLGLVCGFLASGAAFTFFRLARTRPPA